MDKSLARRINRGVKQQPYFETERLILRPLKSTDDLVVRELSNNPKITDMCIGPLDPCGRKVAGRWIAGTKERWAAGGGAEFGIELKGGGEMLGLVGLDHLQAVHASAELEFLLNERYWA